MPARAMAELSTVTMATEPMTITLSTLHGRRPMSRATVMKAMSPPRMGAVDAPPWLAEPVSAVSSRGELRCVTTVASTVRKTMVNRDATSESSSWRSRLRMTSEIDAAMGRPRVPMPPTTFSTRITSDGRRLAPVDRSASSPALVLDASQATPTVPIVSATASTKRARSRGRRTRGGITPSSMTKVPKAPVSTTG